MIDPSLFVMRGPSLVVIEANETARGLMADRPFIDVPIREVCIEEGYAPMLALYERVFRSGLAERIKAPSPYRPVDLLVTAWPLYREGRRWGVLALCRPCVHPQGQLSPETPARLPRPDHEWRTVRQAG